MKNFKVVYYIAAVFILGAAATVYFSGLFSGQETQSTTPKIKLSYYESNTQFAETLVKQIEQDHIEKNYYWIGIEPGKSKHLVLAQSVKEILEKQKPFDIVIVDQELQLKNDELSLLKPTQFNLVKDNWGKISDLVKENKDKKILLITASIYSTNLLKQNPLDKIIQASEAKPITLSMSYFPIVSEDEKNSLFQCFTEDKEGVVAWGCATMNKARALRRKVDFKKVQENTALVTGLMDATSTQDYMILVH